MRIRLAVFAGLLLVFTLNGGNGFAAAIDTDNPNSPDINVVWDRSDIDGVNVYDGIVDRFDNNSDGNFFLDADNLDNGNLNVADNLGYDNQLVDGGVDLFAFDILPSSNVDSDILNDLNQ